MKLIATIYKMLLLYTQAKNQVEAVAPCFMLATPLRSQHSYPVLEVYTEKQGACRAGIVSSGNAWERRSQSYFYSGNGVPRNSIVR